LSSVVVKSADREAIHRAVQRYAAWLRAHFPEIERIIWFGSWVKGEATPGSDVDLCIVVPRLTKPRGDLKVAYLPTGFPVGVDLCVLTSQELAMLPHQSPGLAEAIASGIEVKARSRAQAK